MELAAFPGSCTATARSHCKIVCIDFADGTALVLEGSANLRSNHNTEQLSVTRDRDLHDYYAAWIVRTNGSQRWGQIKPAASPPMLKSVQRVDEVLRLRLYDAQLHDLVQYAAEQNWDVCTRQIKRYITAADKLLAARVEKDRGRLFAKAIANTRSLVRPLRQRGGVQHRRPHLTRPR